ncbi:MAG: hypothetical protein ACHQT8_00785 [Chlamydiales bacterium]
MTSTVSTSHHCLYIQENIDAAKTVLDACSVPVPLQRIISDYYGDCMMLANVVRDKSPAEVERDAKPLPIPITQYLRDCGCVHRTKVMYWVCSGLHREYLRTITISSEALDDVVPALAEGLLLSLFRQIVIEKKHSTEYQFNPDHLPKAFTSHCCFHYLAIFSPRENGRSAALGKDNSKRLADLRMKEPQLKESMLKFVNETLEIS